jgi:hypothetical protein
MNSRRPLNLLWRRLTLEAVLEGYFIKEVLLAGIDRPIRTIVVDANAPMPLLSDALVVSLGTEQAGYLREARGRGLTNIGLLHMADERGDHDRSFYRDADYVLRNYWFADALVQPSQRSLGVYWIPNGYANGVGPIMSQTLLSTAERNIMGFFAGTIEARTLSEERSQLVKLIQDAQLPFMLIGTPGFGQGFTPVTYAAYLCMSRFGLVPGGNSPETIRLYDVLEAGAVPIMLRSPFVSAPGPLDGPPFLLLDSWLDLPAAYAPYADAMSPRVIDEFEAMRRRVYDWWTSFKKLQQNRIRELMDRSFARVAGGT